MSGKESKEKAISPNLLIVKEDANNQPPTGMQRTLFHISPEAGALIEAFKLDLEENNKAKATLRSYLYDVNSFVDYIEIKHLFKGQFNDTELEAYLKLEADSGSKPATVAKRANSILSFNHFLIKRKLMTTIIGNHKAATSSTDQSPQ